MLSCFYTTNVTNVVVETWSKHVNAHIRRVQLCQRQTCLCGEGHWSLTCRIFQSLHTVLHTVQSRQESWEWLSQLECRWELSTFCKHHTVPRAFHTQTFSRVWLKVQNTHFFCAPRKRKSRHRSHQSCFTRSHAWLHSSSTSAPRTPLFPSHVDINCNPHLGGHFGRLAEQSPLAGFEPTILSRWAVRRLRLCSYLIIKKTSNAGVSLEVDESQKLWECWLHRCSRRGGEASAAVPFRTYRSYGVCSETRSSHLLSSTGRPVAMCSHKRKSSRDSNVLREFSSERERILPEHREIRDFPDLRADQAAQGEQAALSKLSEAEHHTRILLEEHRNQILSEARSEMNVYEFKGRECRHGSPWIKTSRFILNACNSTRRISHFHDPETASSSGLSHIPNHPVIVPSPRGMLSRGSSLQPGTRNVYGTSGNVFEDLLAPGEPAAFSGNSTSMASAPCEPVSLTTGRPAAREEELERNAQNSAIPTPRFDGKFSTLTPPSHAEGAYPQNCSVEQPRNQVSDMRFDRFPHLFYTSVFENELQDGGLLLLSLPFGSYAVGIQEVEMVESVDDLLRRRQVESVDSRISRRLMRRLRPPWKRSSWTPTSRKEISLEDRKAQMEDRFLSGRQIAFMIYEYFQVTGAHEAVVDDFDLFSSYVARRRCSRCWYEMGSKSCYPSVRYPQMIFWKVCFRCEHVSLINSKAY